MENVLVIGGAGYVGSQLVPALLETGRSVTVFDTFWYGKSQFNQLSNSRLSLVEADIRDIRKVEEELRKADSVIHLACISNDPSFDLNPDLGRSVNLDCFPPLVRSIKKSGVKRFIYASSSSVYGIRDEIRITEELHLEPLTDYSRFKAKCEEIMFEELGDELVFSVVRPATVCGYSTRQRLDLVVNILTAHALLNQKISVFGGSQFRPNLHITDMVESYIKLLDADTSSIHREIFNVGSKNLTVKEIAEAVQSEIDASIPIEFKETNDLRSYRVDSTKIENKIGFKPRFTVNHAIADLRDNFKSLNSKNPLEDSRYVNILRMKELKLG